MQVEDVDRLDTGQLSAVMALVEAATREDGVAPLSEQVLLAAHDALAPGTTTTSGTATTSRAGSTHFLAYDGTNLAGYAHLERGHGGELGAAPTAEIVVDPGHRRHGIATALIHALEEAVVAGTLQFWSHGHLEAARAMAARDGYWNARELWSMRRSLRPDAGPLPAVDLPDGFAARPFVVGQDEEAWLRVNARAFADHPEQGQMTRLDLDRRIAQSWFDPTGFILVEDLRGRMPVLAASHWTKVVPPDDPQASPTEGEVYVVGVDPAYQGMGLGRTVTILGLVHLRERGLSEVFLYVDADNTAAVGTYSMLGFTRSSVDVMYSRVVHPVMSP